MGEIFEQIMPAEPLSWTGERLTTAAGGQVEIEHLHRYMMARDFCRGLDVLDVASGEGYGTALLAQVAKSAIGVEISAEAAGHAASQYRAKNLRYLQGDARDLPLADESVDVVVSFETIEHFYEQEKFLAEVRRVLRKGGKFIVSSPNREIYSPPGSEANPFHKRELSRQEFENLLADFFPNFHLLCQRPMLGSVLLSDDGEPGRLISIERRGPHHFERTEGVSRPPYLLAIASDAPLPPAANSIFIDEGEIGLLIARAAEHADLKFHLAETLHRAEAAEAAFHGSREELAKCIAEAEAERQAAAAALNSSREELAKCIAQIESAPAPERETQSRELEHAAEREALVIACETLEMKLQAAEAAARQAARERDGVRLSLRRSVMFAERSWFSRGVAADAQISELTLRATNAEASAAAWEVRYYALRAKLERILARSGLLRLSRLVPRPLRRKLVERFLAGNS
jgi:SAM-dependent methyltransferase